MKKIIQFNKAFAPLLTISILLILSGIYAIATKGLNLGLDFKAGLVQDVRFASPAMSISYFGPATISVQINDQSLVFVVSGVGAENTTHVYDFTSYPTVKDLLAAINSIDGVLATAIADDSTESNGFFSNSESSSLLSSELFYLYYLSPQGKEISVDIVRLALTQDLPSASVKQVGDESLRTFQIRVADDGTDEAASEHIKKNIASALTSQFGENNFAVLKTDFIAMDFSKTLVIQVILLLSATLALIWLYATVRFKWDFALGAVLAIMHDAFIMLTFMAWMQMEVTTITVAAILLIIGYSINDTIVVLDRVREKMREPNLKVTSFVQILNSAQTEILARTIITTVTTMFTAFSLYIFTSGSMKDFALALIVGMCSGVYSTIFIASSFIALVRKNWKPSDENKHASGTLSKGIIV
ncbi:MAG: protein translocase subunit SecF [Treponemataceae bacterium]